LLLGPIALVIGGPQFGTPPIDTILISLNDNKIVRSLRVFNDSLEVQTLSTSCDKEECRVYLPNSSPFSTLGSTVATITVNLSSLDVDLLGYVYGVTGAAGVAIDSSGKKVSVTSFDDNTVDFFTATESGLVQSSSVKGIQLPDSIVALNDLLVTVSLQSIVSLSFNGTKLQTLATNFQAGGIAISEN